MRKITRAALSERMEQYHIFNRVAVRALLGYLTLVVLFFFLSGEQLHFRRSRGEIAMPAADSGTVEMAAGNVVEQRFTTAVQCIEQVDVQWGTYYRPNAGAILMELWDMRDNTLLLSGRFDAAAITEGGVTSLTASQPLEGLYRIPLLLRVSSPDCQPGSSPSPLMSVQEALPDSSLYLNGAAADGVLCFAVHGTDYIWTGLHYWEFAAVGLLLLLAALAVIWYRVRLGKRSYVLNAVVATEKYSFLIRQLVARDFKTKYKRSVLGIFWSFLNPLLTMCVQYFVFSTIFKSDIPHYVAYLLVGIVVFNFFSEACGMSLTAIAGNASLITKVYVPKYIYPLTRVISSVINLGISLIPLVLVSLGTGVALRKSTVLAVYFLSCTIIFSLGLGLLLSAAMVFFRDTQFLWGVLSMIWMYVTPIFYPESILPDNFKIILWINPLYHFLKNTRICILDGISPEPTVYLHCMLLALGALGIGSWIFRKVQDRFILYL